MAKSKVAEKAEATKLADVTREQYAAWQREQEAIGEAEATGSPEIVALRKLAHAAERIFEHEGITSRRMTPLEILGEALRCARSDFSVLGDASGAESGMVDGMVFRRAELRIDLALALAEHREKFAVTSTESATEGGAS
jgi:hypothetical protein